MNIRAVITPAGKLHFEISEESSAETVSVASETGTWLNAAFSGATADGLWMLLSEKDRSRVPPSAHWWRRAAELFLRRLWTLDEDALKRLASKKTGGSEKSLDQLVAGIDESELDGLLQETPAMRGLEYLTSDVLKIVCRDLLQLVLQKAAAAEEGLIAWLQAINPLWHLLGRVTFHLAENKRDPDRPFAFLATYTHRVSARAELKHLPLAEALTQYAGQKNRARLTELLAPVRHAAKVSPLIREMLDTRRLFQPHALSVDQAHRFLTSVPEMEQAGLVVRVPDWWKVRHPPRAEVSVRVGQHEASLVGLDSLMDFQVDVALDGDTLTAEERDRILKSTDGLVLLRGRWVEVDAERLQQALDHWKQVEQQYSDGIDFVQGMRMLAGVQLGRETEDTTESGWTRVTAGDWLQTTLQQIRNPSGEIDCQPGKQLKATLRPYQKDGVRWLWFMTQLGLGGCLADDMGLGKTVQVIDLLLLLREGDRKRSGRRTGKKTDLVPSLLVVPASLVGNWKSELERFAPVLNVMYAHRSECDAETLQQLKQSPQESVRGFDAVVTTYGLARRLPSLGDVDWRLIVLDEAQAIKNASSAQAKAIRRLKSRGRIALTGTPVENHLGELWSLFDFCCPGLLGKLSQFRAFVKSADRDGNGRGYGALRDLVRPYLLRRLKTDPGIVPDLPEKTEMRAECGLSKKQVTLYEKTVRDLEKRLESSDGMERRGIVLATLMQLKQICNHASLFLGQDEFSLKDSGKFQRLEQICHPIGERQERVLVFTQFQSMVEPLSEFLAGIFGRPGLVLHGGVAVRKRKRLVDEFQADDGPPFFVISVKAGGTGLNLTAASHVVHFDRWWNPAVENQATDRAFRIGQKRSVLVHKFVCRGTVEERIDEMIRNKQALADEILSDGAETQLTEMSDEELLQFVSIDLSRATGDAL